MWEWWSLNGIGITVFLLTIIFHYRIKIAEKKAESSLQSHIEFRYNYLQKSVDSLEQDKWNIPKREEMHSHMAKLSQRIAVLEERTRDKPKE